MRLLIAFCSLLVTLSASADMPSTERTRKEANYAFGDIRIKQIFDSRKDPMSPDFIMEVRAKGRLIMHLSDVSFDDIVSSANHTLFVGLSNGGWPGSAVIVFDNRGQILLLARHGASQFDYCATTSTFMRQWYNHKDPQVKFPAFKYGTENIPGITIKDCYGKTIDLLDTVRKANEAGYRALREEVAGHSFVPDK
jgi:hypothetical protein